MDIDKLNMDIMNIPCNVEELHPEWTNDNKLSYRFGHRDARHAAVEVMLEHFKEESATLASQEDITGTSQEETTGASVKTWQERSGMREFIMPKDAVPHMLAEIADLRAQLAVKTKEADAWAERWLKGRQLAAKGQGMPSGYTVKHVEGHGWVIDAPKSGRWVAFDGTPAGELLADLSAPASAAAAPSSAAGKEGGSE